MEFWFNLSIVFNKIKEKKNFKNSLRSDEHRIFLHLKFSGLSISDPFRMFNSVSVISVQEMALGAHRDVIMLAHVLHTREGEKHAHSRLIHKLSQSINSFFSIHFVLATR